MFLAVSDVGADSHGWRIVDEILDVLWWNFRLRIVLYPVFQMVAVLEKGPHDVFIVVRVLRVLLALTNPLELLEPPQRPLVLFQKPAAPTTLVHLGRPPSMSYNF